MNQTPVFPSLNRSLELRSTLLTLGKTGASSVLPSLNRSLELRSRLLTLGKTGASSVFPSLNRSLDLGHVAARDGERFVAVLDEQLDGAGT